MYSSFVKNSIKTMSTVKKMKRFIYISFFSFLSLNAQKSINNTLDELSDKFQTNFFEALEQKGIENYEKAIELLIVCNNLNPNNAAVNFELGKNYYELDRELLAESSFIKADKLKPNNQWVLEGLYNLYRSQNNNFKTIETLQKLNKINQKYSITLVELYYKNNQHNEALVLLNKLDKNGRNKNIEELRNRVYLNGKMFEEQSNYLEKKISDNSATETDYVKLIYAYSKLNSSEKSFDTAVLFSKKLPKSDVAHLSLYKFYMSKKEIDKAITSMNIVLISNSINNSDKLRVINDFLNFTKDNLGYLSKLENAVNLYPNITVSSKMALLYTKIDNEKAKKYISSITNNNATSFNDLKLLGTIYLKENRIEESLKNSEKALSLYPAQPIFYLQLAKAFNKNTKAKKAIESLEFGLDYLIDNPKMETDFYIEMAKAYAMLNDKKNQEKYLQKIKQNNEE